MRRTIRLTERDLARMVRRVVKESQLEMDLDMDSDMEEMDDIDGDSIRVRDFAYEMITDYVPEGPRNKVKYRRAIEQLEKEFNYALRNLKGNIGM